MKRKASIILKLLLPILGICQAAQAVEVTNIPTAVDQLLQEYGPVQVTRHTTLQIPYRYCTQVPGGGRAFGVPSHYMCTTKTQAVDQTKVTSAILTATDIRIVGSSPMIFGSPIQTTLPDQMASESLDICNPYQVTTSQQIIFSQQIQHSDTVTLTHSVTNSTSDSLSGSVKLLNGALTLGANVSIGSQSTSGMATATGSMLNQTISAQVTEQAPPQSDYGMEFLVTLNRPGFRGGCLV